MLCGSEKCNFLKKELEEKESAHVKITSCIETQIYMLRTIKEILIAQNIWRNSVILQ
jgi:hypothetical protein